MTTTINLHHNRPDSERGTRIAPHIQVFVSDDKSDGFVNLQTAVSSIGYYTDTVSVFLPGKTDADLVRSLEAIKEFANELHNLASEKLADIRLTEHAGAAS